MTAIVKNAGRNRQIYLNIIGNIKKKQLQAQIARLRRSMRTICETFASLLNSHQEVNCRYFLITFVISNSCLHVNQICWLIIPKQLLAKIDKITDDFP